MDCGAHTSRGRVRENDEDTVFYAQITGLGEGFGNTVTLGVVADGMGGGERGEVASRLAVHALAESVAGLVFEGELSAEKVREAMLGGVSEANRRVARYAREHGIRTMGTTLTAALVVGDTVYVANIGDSRTYLVSCDGKVRRRTKDHSYVQELVDEGYITEEEARTHPQRNIVTRVIDGSENAQPDLYEWRIYRGDTLVLCCDGVWEALGDQIIASIASSQKASQEKARLLVEAADELDGSDNASAVVLTKTDGADEAEALNAQTRKAPEDVKPDT